MPQPTRTYN